MQKSRTTQNRTKKSMIKGMAVLVNYKMIVREDLQKHL